MDGGGGRSIGCPLKAKVDFDPSFRNLCASPWDCGRPVRSPRGTFLEAYAEVSTHTKRPGHLLHLPTVAVRSEYRGISRSQQKYRSKGSSIRSGAIMVGLIELCPCSTSGRASQPSVRIHGQRSSADADTREDEQTVGIKWSPQLPREHITPKRKHLSYRLKSRRRRRRAEVLILLYCCLVGIDWNE